MSIQDLGTRIKQQREKRGLKQNDLAHALQISPQAVSKWERGENAPDISLLVPLAKLLGVSADWLLGGFAEDRDVFEATVLVSGVQSARQMSETMSPSEFAAWTNGVCSQITEAVLQHGGVPIKYVGPGILCFFSGIEHAKRAVQTALTARTTMTVPLKIGISSGRIYFGAVGHPDYSQPDIMGEAVSIALLSCDWAAGNTKSGIVACTGVTDSLGEIFSFGTERQERFGGISHAVKLREIEC